MIACSIPDGDDLVSVLLQKGADVDIKNHNGQTALHFCASKNNIDIARMLIRNNASARIKDKRGQLPLHRAAAAGSVPLVNLLLQNRSPLDSTDTANQTALHHGELLQLPCIRLLICDESGIRRARRCCGRPAEKRRSTEQKGH